MPTQTVNLDKVEKQLAELLAIVEDDGEIVITQDGKPLARLESVAPQKKKRISGLNRGMIWTSKDFDEPLPDEFWLGKE
ncbi:MAG: type II toxin-antitoxin system prevent-host-death family antitoxin [Pyrinomonadaceae bacterium]|nr:type II toxin-antitoxin system prevent-host-death family antitoxin [Pyrinomonadaceae bacterium]